MLGAVAVSVAVCKSVALTFRTAVAVVAER